jgi:hypothetical protein
MGLLFNRQVELEIGRAGAEGRKFSELRIDFEVEKSRESNANTGKITVYNLSKPSRDVISIEGAKYILKAGYFGFGETPLIEEVSSGDVVSVDTIRSGPDLVTTIKIGEGIKALGEKTLDKSYEQGTSVKTVVDEMAKELGVVKSTIEGVKDAVFNSGYSATGKIKDRLDELTAKEGLEWNIQNNELQILPKNGSTKEEAIFLSKDTGLLKAYKGKSEVNGVKDLKDIVFFEALLNPRIKIGQKIQVVSEINGIDQVVIVRKIKYQGSNREGKFICMGEAS